MRALTLPVLAAGLLLIGCDAPTPLPTALKVPTVLLAVGQGNGIQHRVSVGSHDFTAPGFDANFSLIAIQHADGTVSGQWEDKFGPGNGFEGGVHVEVNCLEVDGNRAWISGIVTKSADESEVGTIAATMVEDNGTSANDPPDRISFTWTRRVNPCHIRYPFMAAFLFPLTSGEVKVD